MDLLTYAAAAVELAVLVLVARKSLELRRAYRERAGEGGDLLEALRAAARAVLGRRVGGVVAYEAAVFGYALLGWRRAVPTGPGTFAYHRASGYVALALAVMIAVVIETAALHALLWQWSRTAAWVSTAIGTYGLIWILGDLQACRLRPTVVGDGGLAVRVGLRWTADIPFERIARIERPPGPPPRRRSAYLKAVLLGAPDCRLVLAEPVAAEGPYGIVRRARVIDLRLDDPDGFVADVREGAESAQGREAAGG